MTKIFPMAVLRSAGLPSLLVLYLMTASCFISSHDAAAQGSPHFDAADILDPRTDAPPSPLGGLRLDGQDTAPHTDDGHDSGLASGLQLKFYGDPVPFDSNTKEMLPRIDLTSPSDQQQPALPRQ